MRFPEATIFNQKIPKERFYENLDIENKIKERFVNEIDSICLKNKLSKDTLGIKGTKNVEELFVFSIKLKKEIYFDKIEDLLLLIDRAIPYPILYEFELEDGINYKIAYKEKSKANENESVVEVYLTKSEDKSFEKEMKGIFNSLNLEILYEKIIKIFLEIKSKEPAKQLIENYEKRKILEKEIEVLEKKVKTEKQADRQFKMLNELGIKKKDLEELQ